jgi:hypothetical protein
MLGATLANLAAGLPTARNVKQQYRKTLVSTQVLIGVITLGVLFRTQRLAAALAFFATMQIGALIGALWAVRLKSKIERARWKDRA